MMSLVLVPNAVGWRPARDPRTNVHKHVAARQPASQSARGGMARGRTLHSVTLLPWAVVAIKSRIHRSMMTPQLCKSSCLGTPKGRCSHGEVHAGSAESVSSRRLALTSALLCSAQVPRGLHRELRSRPRTCTLYGQPPATHASPGDHLAGHANVV